MKKILLAGLALHFVAFGFSQGLSQQDLYNKTYTKKLTSDGVSASNVLRKPNQTVASQNNKASYEEEVLGNTFYDLQTNSAVQRRLMRDGDGNMAAVWTASTENNMSWSDRGTGYSFFDGSGWTLSGDYPRIETVRCGWPNILFPASGGEVVISHQSIPMGGTTDTKLRFNSRASRGSGSWTEKLVSNTDLTWPRAVMGGADGNSIHLIAVSDEEDTAKFDGLRRALIYYRSEDGGSTFNIQDSLLPDLSSTNMGPIGGDNYAIAAQGETIVIGVADTWNDVFILKSTDNGDTWTRSVAYNHPFAKTDIVTDIVTDTAACPDGAIDIMIDQNGDAHIFWSWVAAFNDALEPPDDAVFTFFGFREGLLYWNESKAADDVDTIARVVDQNGDGQITLSGFPNYGASLTSFPSSAIDANGTIYVSYAGIHELLNDADAPADNYRHLYVIKSEDGGATWSDPVDINPLEEFTENVFAALYREVESTPDGDFLHILYQRDPDPGVSTADTDTDPQPVTDNEIVYAKVNTLLNVGIKEEKVVNNLNVYPNPTSDLVTINFDLRRPGLVRTEIVNVMGQQVKAIERQVNNASQNRVQIDMSDFPAGIYMVNIVPEEGAPSAVKLIVE